MEMNYRNTLTVIALILLVPLSQVVNANTHASYSNSTARDMQNPSGGQRRGGFERDDLNITADQKAKLESIRQSERDQIQAVRNDSSLSPQDKEAKVRAIQDSARQQAMQLLTPEQQQKLQNARKDHRLGGPRGGGPGGGPFEDLGLTPEQKSQIQTIHQDAESQIAAIRNDSTLTPDQKREKMRSIMESIHQPTLNVLTPEQQQKLKERRQNHKGGFGGRHGPRGGIFGSPPRTN
jgi:Spy/CpxP family protein refolding chaperone